MTFPHYHPISHCTSFLTHVIFDEGILMSTIAINQSTDLMTLVEKGCIQSAAILSLEFYQVADDEIKQYKQHMCKS